MRYAILSDIHANLEALRTVLDDAAKQDVDAYYCLGDVVGYGANPCECVDIIRDICAATVAGNHDYAAVDKTSIEYFNSEARSAVLWTRNALSPEHKQFLEGLDLVLYTDDFVLVHSTLHGPELFNYVLSPFDAMLCMQELTRTVCLLGHSHVPLMFIESTRIDMRFEYDYTLAPDERAVVNVGSVGQPRDQSPQASYGIYDPEARHVEIRRIEYDVQTAAGKILEAGLPESNATRLLAGR